MPYSFKCKRCGVEYWRQQSRASVYCSSRCAYRARRKKMRKKAASKREPVKASDLRSEGVIEVGAITQHVLFVRTHARIVITRAESLAANHIDSYIIDRTKELQSHGWKIREIAPMFGVDSGTLGNALRRSA